MDHNIVEKEEFLNKYQVTKALKGVDRLVELHALPMIDYSAIIGFEGSISKMGDNADWDWYLYPDQNNEWVLFEADGAGCIYNLTQHRYPTSKEPTFNFYFDHSETPQYSIKLSEFGLLNPFLAPVSDKYIGPDEGGRGPIWVVRSFIPMCFTKHCKVTSTVKLEGCDKAKGEGGWGHITYHLYDTAIGIETFTGNEDYSDLKNIALNAGLDPKYAIEKQSSLAQDFMVKPGEAYSLYQHQGEGSISSIKLSLLNTHDSVLRDLRIRIFWDNHSIPNVDAPIGTFFGNEYGQTEADIKTIMVGMKLSRSLLEFYNYFSMPFWENAIIELYNVGETDVYVQSCKIAFTSSAFCSYPKSSTGYFVSSKYYEKTDNIEGINSIIATLNGTGHMVYGTISGYDITRGGCEGDVRIFIDGKDSPVVESDGSESWASYGWGFVTPPQTNPFSAYNGKYGSNSDWSEVRLTLGDSYNFKKSIRFELEHGDFNDAPGMGKHSGQIFCYMIPKETLVLTDIIQIGDKDSEISHQYSIQGTFKNEQVNSAYANGINKDKSFEGFVKMEISGCSSFIVNIAENNKGIVLQRLSSQRLGRQCANVYIDDVLVAEKKWFYADNNPFYTWLDDEFQIPGKYTTGKAAITIKIEPLDVGEGNTWNESKYTVYAMIID